MSIVVRMVEVGNIAALTTRQILNAHQTIRAGLSSLCRLMCVQIHHKHQAYLQEDGLMETLSMLEPETLERAQVI